MIITVVNNTQGLLKDNAYVLQVIRAISRQVFYDFQPYWNLSAQVRLAVDKDQPIYALLDPVSRDSVIYLERWKHHAAQHPELSKYRFGYHGIKRDGSGKRYPVGYVFVDKANGEERKEWTVTLSHEVLELVANPHLNLWILGPHPEDHLDRKNQPKEKDLSKNDPRKVFIHRELCDPVQNTYPSDGIAVSNFVLPLYFVEDGDKRERVDFLGDNDPVDGSPLKSFGIRCGGYLPFSVPSLDGQGRLTNKQMSTSRHPTTGAYCTEEDESTSWSFAHRLIPGSPPPKMKRPRGTRQG
jgi:hypothetical protein